MKTKKNKIKGNSKTKKNSININNFHEKIKITYFQKPTFLSSCFQYYYGNIEICNKICNPLVLSNSFLETINKGPLVIIDYPNIIHILYEKYGNKEFVYKIFYTFIYNQLNQLTKFYIISKNVVIDNIPFDIETVFNEGYKLTGKIIDKKYFKKEHINIYNLSYSIKENVSSSIDDLLGYFICFILYVYLSNSNINPNEKLNQLFKKINIITNDKQFFNKNLFGLSEDERKFKINIKNDLSINILTVENNHYTFVKNKLDKLLLINFFNEYMVTTSNDIKNLECKISILLQILHNSTYKTNTQQFFSYNNINHLQKKYLEKYKYKSKCNGLEKIITKENNLLKYYYLYTFIKYIQIHLHANNKTKLGEIELYGSQSKEKIIHIFSFPCKK
jgi:hypothetical protein